MNWITKLERKYGRFCIPNLINILIGGQILYSTMCWSRRPMPQVSSRMSVPYLP